MPVEPSAWVLAPESSAHAGQAVPPSRQLGVLAGVTTNICGMELLGAQVWHYWLAVPLAVATVATVAKLVVGYVQKVVSPRYPKR